MGQRLVIQIEYDGEPLANAYYHWSGYTGVAIQTVNEIVDNWDNADENFNHIQKAVWLLYETGARFSQNEIDASARENISTAPFQFVFDGIEADRNNGLLCVSEQGMKESMNWAEATVIIDMKSECIDFNVYYTDTAEYFAEEYETNLDNIPTLDINEDFIIGSWPETSRAILDILDAGHYHAITPDRSMVYNFI